MSRIIFLFLLFNVSVLLQREALSSVIYQTTDTDMTLSAVFAILQDGKLIEKGVTGCEKHDYSAKKCITEVDFNTPFAISSMSKQFTAAAILLLEEDNLLSVNDSITQHLPYLSKTMSAITIKHLIAHMSGVSDYLNNPIFDFDDYYNKRITIDNAKVIEYINKNAGFKNRFRSYYYSNSGYVLLSLIVEKVSGMPFADFLQRRFFIPLKMNNTFIIDKENHTRCLVGHSAWPFAIKKDRAAVLQTTGDQGMCTSMNDYIKWINALQNNKVFNNIETGSKFFSRLKIDGKLSVFNRTTGGNVFSYGYGWRHGFFKDNIPMMWHAGHVRGQHSIAFYLIEYNVWVILFVNSDIGELNDLMLDIVANIIGQIKKSSIP